MNKEIANILRKNGSLECIRKSEVLENYVSEISSLNLRNLNLEMNDIVGITNIIDQKNSDNEIYIKSISFSYNTLIGDAGAVLLAKKLPPSISELGLVACGIKDKGGTEILNWMKKSFKLKMICIEQNNFSDTLKKQFNIFKNENPKIMVIY